MLKILEQWVFPNICCVCDHNSTTGQDLCSSCKASLPWIEDRCFRCGLFLEGRLESVYCQRCIASPPKFDRLCALFSYDPPLIQLITGLKFAAELSYGRILGELLAESVMKVWYKERSLPEAVLPVPLHRSRLQKRGFNQTLELLSPFKKRYNVPVLANACSRIRKTPAQSQLNQNRRKYNMKNAFQVIAPLPFEHVAIMDDVVTTGSTVNTLAQALKEVGVVTVDVWCICRA